MPPYAHHGEGVEARVVRVQLHGERLPGRPLRSGG